MPKYNVAVEIEKTVYLPVEAETAQEAHDVAHKVVDTGVADALDKQEAIDDGTWTIAPVDAVALD